MEPALESVEPTPFAEPYALARVGAVHARSLRADVRPAREPVHRVRGDGDDRDRDRDDDSAAAHAEASTGRHEPVVTRMADLRTVEEALELILARAERLPAEPVSLARADRPSPRRAGARARRSAAVSELGDGRLRGAGRGDARAAAHRRADRGGQPARGSRCRSERSRRIATGGAVPEGADAVVPVERTAESDGHVEIRERPRSRTRTFGRAEATCERATRSSSRARPAGRPDRRARRRRSGGGRVRSAPARGRARDRLGAARAGRAARARPDLRVEPHDDRGGPRDRGSRGRRASRSSATTRRRTERGARGGLDGRRARDLRRRLDGAARPRAARRGRARGRGGLLGRRRQAGQAALVRRPRLDARVRASRKPGLLARRLGPLRMPGAPRACRGRPCRGRRSRPGGPPGRCGGIAHRDEFVRARRESRRRRCSCSSP